MGAEIFFNDWSNVMYPRNAASPERIAVGVLVQISDGAVQTSGGAVTVRGQGGAESAGAGTIAYGASGLVYYTPTQAETNFTSFVVVATKTGCIPVAQTIITTASATPGKVVLSGETHTSAVIPTVTTLTNLPAITADWLTAAGIAADAGAEIAAATLTSALTEAYRADGATGTVAQLLYEIIAHLGESSITGTVKTIKKIDGTTSAATFTLNDATTPTAITRTT